MGQYDFSKLPELTPSSEAVRQQQSDTGLLTKLIVGVLMIAVGVYIGNVLYTRYLAYKANLALLQISPQVRAAAKWSQLMQAKMQAKIDEDRQYQLALERERTHQKQMEQAYRQEQINRQIADQDDANRKEIAWNQHYKKPAMCENASQQSVLVECGNHYSKERNKFEESWARQQASPGKLVIQ